MVVGGCWRKGILQTLEGSNFPWIKNARLAACFPKSTLAMAGMGTSPGAGPGAVGGLVGIWDPAPNVHEWQLVS